jgi:mono/diheme cytochrome c family protein
MERAAVRIGKPSDRGPNMRVTAGIFGALIIAALMYFSHTWVRNRMAPESAPVARGAEYAQVRGCVDCHGDANDHAADANNVNCSNANTMRWHPDYAVQCSDVMAYFETVRLRRSLDERRQIGPNSLLTAGETLARKYHCFQCHGHMGQGGFANAGSFKGYVPGYFGDDFKILTNNANPDSVRSWIVNGMDAAIVQEPVTGLVAQFFFWRQAVSMPSFKSLPDDEIDILVNYVIALNGFGPMTADDVRDYDKLSRSTADVAGLNHGGASVDQVSKLDK